MLPEIWYNDAMEKTSKLTEEQLNQVPKDVLVTMYLQLADTMKQVAEQNNQLLRQVTSLEEKISILTQRHFGRKTEKASEIDELQMTFDFYEKRALNEAEHILDSANADEIEPDPSQSVRKRTKRKGKRLSDLQYLETVIDEHTIPEEALNKYFPRGYDILPHNTYYTVEFVPAKFVEHEHHVFKYAGKHGEGIRVADAPEKLLPNSILTPSLAAGIFCCKYVNTLPLSRQAEDFERVDMNISRQTLANWMISISDRYVQIIYRRMHQKMLESRLIHCDETPFKLIAPDKGPNSKAYMWGYHTMEVYGSHPIFLYEYQGKFCVGKHSWHIIGSRRGAKASAVLYSIAETSKANGLKPYEYFKYLLEQMLAHLDDKPADYIDDLLPWSEKIPEYCRLKTFE